MKVLKVISNRVVPTTKRVTKLLLACGHEVKLTMETHMKPPRHWRAECRKCRYGDPPDRR